jgi:hypothetical protein
MRLHTPHAIFQTAARLPEHPCASMARPEGDDTVHVKLERGEKTPC